MTLKRLSKDQVYRFYVASPLAFANWQEPTVAELNANPTNDPNGLIFNITCALSTDGTQFDLDDPTLDDNLTFCQDAGNGEVAERSATIVYEFEESQTRWAPATSVLAADGFNTANLTKSLLSWRGIEMFGILSVGKGPDTPFAVGDRLKIGEFATDWAIPSLGTGDNIRWTQTTAKRSRLAWNITVTA